MSDICSRWTSRSTATQVAPPLSLACMKDVAAKADPLRDKLPRGPALNPVEKVMRALIDGPYLLLGNGEADRRCWRAARMVVEQAITDLKPAASSRRQSRSSLA